MAKTGFLNKVQRALCLGHADTAGCTSEDAVPGFIAQAPGKQAAAVFVGLHEEALLRTAPSIASTLAEQQQLAEALAHFTSRPSRSRSVDAAAAAPKLSLEAAAPRASLTAPAHLPPLKLAAKKPQGLHPSTFAPLSSQQFDWTSCSDPAPKAAAPPSPMSLFYMTTAFTTTSAASATAAYSQLSGLTGLSTASASNLNFCAAALLTHALSSTGGQRLCGPGPACADWSVSMGYGCNRTRTSGRAVQPYTWVPSGAASERHAHAPTSRLFKQSSTSWVMAV